MEHLTTAERKKYLTSVAKRIVDAFPEVEAVYLDGSYVHWNGEITSAAFLNMEAPEMSEALARFTIELEEEMQRKGYSPCIDLTYGEYSERDILLYRREA